MNNKLIISDILNLDSSVSESVIAIGKFSLIHQGHVKVLNELVELSTLKKVLPVVFSFFPSPTFVFSGEKPVYSIKSRFFQLKLFFSKIDFLFFLQKFNESFISLSPEEFILKLKKVFRMKAIVVGENFRFGKDGRGDVEFLIEIGKKYNIEIKIIKMPNEDKNTNISSSTLKKLLVEGNIEQFNCFVLEKYFLEGYVICGKQLAGSVFGFKTANIILKSFLQSIKFGVYACKCLIGKNEYFGIVNIGKKPTVGNFIPLAEVHLFNFDQNIYGKKIKIFPMHFLREEKKFPSLDELKYQIVSDISKVKEILKI